MNIVEAAKILNLNGEVCKEDIKLAYRRAGIEYHPDRNPAGLEMMKAVNLAYEILKDYEGSVANEANQYGDCLMVALNFAKNLDGVTIEVCGNWIWLSGKTKPYRKELKETKTHFADNNGFCWASKKKRWYFRPLDWKSLGRGKMSMEEIRQEHGSKFFTGEPLKRIA